MLKQGNSYREEFEATEYDQTTTSTDNTETEASDADKSEKKKNKRRSRLPWSSGSDLASTEAKISSVLSFASAPAGEGTKSPNKIKKKKRPKNGGIHVDVTDIAVKVDSTESLTSPPTAISTADQGPGMLSPKPWTEQSNISYSSLKSSNNSRQSRVSSNRSSFEIPRRPVTPTDRPTAPIPPPTTFAAIQQRSVIEGAQLDNGDLPIQVITPMSGSEKPRSNSYSSNHSGGSTGKGSRIGGWLKKKRGVSTSSSASAAGGGSAVGD